MISKKTINGKIKEIDEKSWFPVEVIKVNDHMARLALLRMDSNLF